MKNNEQLLGFEKQAGQKRMSGPFTELEPTLAAKKKARQFRCYIVAFLVHELQQAGNSPFSIPAAFKNAWLMRAARRPFSISQTPDAQVMINTQTGDAAGRHWLASLGWRLCVPHRSANRTVLTSPWLRVHAAKQKFETEATVISSRHDDGRAKRLALGHFQELCGNPLMNPIVSYSVFSFENHFRLMLLIFDLTKDPWIAHRLIL